MTLDSPAPDRPRLTGTLVASTLIAALGGLLFGFDTAVISGTTDALRSVYAPGRVLARLHRGQRADRHDRRRAGAWAGRPTASGRRDRARSRSPCSTSSRPWAARSPGTGARSSSSASSAASASAGRRSSRPMYIAEISPGPLRGRLVAVTPVQHRARHPAGLLLELPASRRLDLGAAEWRWMFGVEAVPGGGLLLPALPDAARARAGWWPRAGWTRPARVLARLGTDAGERRRRDPRRSRPRSTSSTTRLGEPFFQPAYRQPILLAVAIADVQPALRASTR